MQGPQVLLTQQSAAVTVIPGTAALTLTPFAPSVLTPRLVTVGVASLTTARFAPTVSTPRLVTLGKASLVTATFAPVVTVASGSQTVTPGTAALVLTGFAPSAVSSSSGGSHRVGPQFIRRAAPQVLAQPVLVEPVAASLSLVAFAPSVTTNDDELVLILAA